MSTDLIGREGLVLVSVLLGNQLTKDWQMVEVDQTEKYDIIKLKREKNYKALPFDNKDTINCSEAAKFLGITIKTLYAWVKDKKVPGIRIGKLWRFNIIVLKNWIENNGKNFIRNYEKDTLSTVETAKFLDISTKTLFRWIKDKNVPCFKVGGLWKFKKEELNRWVNENK